MRSASLRFMIDLKSVDGDAGSGRAADANLGRLGKSASPTSIKISATREAPTTATIALVTSICFEE